MMKKTIVVLLVVLLMMPTSASAAIIQKTIPVKDDCEIALWKSLHGIDASNKYANMGDNTAALQMYGEDIEKILSKYAPIVKEEHDEANDLDVAYNFVVEHEVVAEMIASGEQNANELAKYKTIRKNFMEMIESKFGDILW
ncbi:MAG: hypothetical protein LBN08_01595 [Lactobacillales bacterium]|jgi:hypothetical protein|nr:hypothetical protein [Lactobacillales bacterium]